MRKVIFNVKILIICTSEEKIATTYLSNNKQVLKKDFENSIFMYISTYSILYDPGFVLNQPTLTHSHYIVFADIC